MSERGFSLVEAVIALGVVAVLMTGAVGLLAAMPRQAAAWEDAADAHQRFRVIDARGARLTGNTSAIVVRVGASVARVPAVWPRRLGLTGAGAPADVSTRAATFIARAGGHRLLTLDEPLMAGGGSVAATAGPGCGASSTCRLASGDLLLAVSASSDAGLYRVSAAGARLTLDGLTAGAAFGPGDVLLPVELVSLALAAAGELRAYDGYRSDNVIVDGLEALSLTLAIGAPPHVDASERGGPFVDDEGRWRGTGHLGDGPWVGVGQLMFDVDQLALTSVAADVSLRARGERSVERALFHWRVP